MKTLLVHPPLADASCPPLGLAALTGFLRSHGEKVKSVDLNIGSMYALLEPAQLRVMLSRLGERLAKLDDAGCLTRREAEEYALVARAVMFGEHVIQSVPGALRDLKSTAVYGSRAAYSDAADIVLRAMEIVAAAHYPAEWTPRELSFGQSPVSSSRVLDAAADPGINFYYPYLQQSVSGILDWNPDLIGISINYLCQLVPGITLASMIKREDSSPAIVLGGALISAYRDRWHVLRSFFDVVDAMIPFEGELPLLRLIDALRDGGQWLDVPGVIHRTGNLVCYNDPADQSAPGDRTLPDFSDFPLDSYISGQRVLPYRTSYGCYWGHCTFCAHHLVYSNGYRQKSIGQIAEDLKNLSERYDASVFYLVDDAIPLATMRGLSRKVISGELPLTWFGETRFEHGLDRPLIDTLAQGGCRMLIFGLESSVPRVLAAMNKGTDPNTAARVLADCRAAGIRTHVMFFLGFPGESAEESARTLEFVETHAPSITHVGFSNFALLHGSPVYANSKENGISILNGDRSDDLALKSKYRVAEGISESEAERAATQAKNRPGMRALLELSLVSRNHLSLLPPRSIAPAQEPRPSFQVSPELRLRLRNDLTAISLNFDVGAITELIRSEATLTGEDTDIVAKRKPSTYLISPSRLDVVDIGEDGMLIASMCDGSRPIAAMLELAGPDNQDVVSVFVEELYDRGMLVTCQTVEEAGK